MAFFIAGRCEEAMKKAVLEPLASALAEGLFYINDIIASLQKPKTILTLCDEL
jgi:tetrahydromethanopterin S-methyltransferase subunit D